jgi:hypothetical protein
LLIKDPHSFFNIMEPFTVIENIYALKAFLYKQGTWTR